MSSMVVSEKAKGTIDKASKELMEKQSTYEREFAAGDISSAKYNEYIANLEYSINFLSTSINIGRIELFTGYMKCFGKFIKDIDLPLSHVYKSFNYMKEIFIEKFYEKDVVERFIDEGLKSLNEAYMKYKPTNNLIFNMFLEKLLKNEKEEAGELISNLIKEGMDIKKIYLDIFEPSILKIGELWETGEISIASERYCTSAIQGIMTAMNPYIFNYSKSIRKGKKLIAACDGDERYEACIRMTADLFELDGWDTYCLNTNISTEKLVLESEKMQVDLIIIYAAPYNLETVKNLISAVRDDGKLKNTKIIAVGKVSHEDESLWREIGADGYSKVGSEAVEIGNRLIYRVRI